MTLLSTRLYRADGPEKVTGQARYTADLALPGMLHAKLLYAAHPHARVVSVDTTEARTLAGVLAVVTQRDVPPVRYGTIVKDRTLFADGIVRFEGEVVAAVAAITPELAEQACRMIRVEYELLEPVLDPEQALTDAAELVHSEWQSYADGGQVRRGNDCAYVTIAKGDVADGFKQADVIIEGRYATDMSHPVPIEPHAVVAEWQGPRLTVWTTTQMPFAARAGVAEALRMPESAVRVVVPHLGGGFGGKCDVHFEPHVAALARQARRPVRLVLSRHEEFIAPDMTRHPIIIEFRTGARRDGTITAHQGRLVLDTGAYAAHGPAISEHATMMAAGPYRIPHLLLEAHTVYTNRTPAGSTRAPSGPQTCWALEQHLDELAERLDIDPCEFRRLNLVQDGDEGPTGQQLEGVGAKQCLEKAVDLIGWGKEREADEGIGLACGWWGNLSVASGAFVKLSPDGTATVVTGAQENGSGAVMGLALLAAEELGLKPEQVSLVYQDTEAGPWDLGSGGSQTTFANGPAVIAAAAQVRQRLFELAADELEAAPDDLELVDGAARVRGSPQAAVAIANLAAKAFAEGELILGHGAPLPPPVPENVAQTTCVGRNHVLAFVAPSFFCHAARVRVDRETGIVRVIDVIAVHDFGRVLNPLGAEGQVEGGVVNGVGIALSEGTQYAQGRQLNAHLLDYKLQTAADAPTIKVAFVDAPVREGGPHGSKGVGEPPVIATAGAIANAIAEATRTRVRRLPMTPYRVWATLQGEEV